MVKWKGGNGDAAAEFSAPGSSAFPSQRKYVEQERLFSLSQSQ